MRKNWNTLNGEWQFEYDFSVSGSAKELYKTDKEFSMKINVPFCPESKLSGIGNVDFLNSVWYKRDFTISEENLKDRILLHFGAVD